MGEDNVPKWLNVKGKSIYQGFGTSYVFQPGETADMKKLQKQVDSLTRLVQTKYKLNKNNVIIITISIIIIIIIMTRLTFGRAKMDESTSILAVPDQIQLVVWPVSVF
mgnify:CR=1 FL=1